MRKTGMIAMTLLLAGCGASEQRQAAKDCMAKAVNATILTSQTDSELDTALGQQDLTRCPPEFIEKFVAVGNAVHLYVGAQQELASHEGQQDAVIRNSAFVTLRDAFNGSNSGQTPLADWQAEGSELQQRVARYHRDMEESMAAVKLVLGHYGMFISTAPVEDASNATGSSNAM